MKAVALTKYLQVDDPESFLDVELDTPEPTGRDILVEVKAISVTRSIQRSARPRTRSNRRRA